MWPSAFMAVGRYRNLSFGAGVRRAEGTRRMATR